MLCPPDAPSTPREGPMQKTWFDQWFSQHTKILHQGLGKSLDNCGGYNARFLRTLAVCMKLKPNSQQYAANHYLVQSTFKQWCPKWECQGPRSVGNLVPTHASKSRTRMSRYHLFFFLHQMPQQGWLPTHNSWVQTQLKTRSHKNQKFSGRLTVNRISIRGGPCTQATTSPQPFFERKHGVHQKKALLRYAEPHHLHRAARPQGTSRVNHGQRCPAPMHLDLWVRGERKLRNFPFSRRNHREHGGLVARVPWAMLGRGQCTRALLGHEPGVDWIRVAAPLRRPCVARKFPAQTTCGSMGDVWEYAIQSVQKHMPKNTGRTLKPPNGRAQGQDGVPKDQSKLNTRR